MKILVIGDLHGDWGKLNALLVKKQPDIVLQCGDFGWWPKMEVQKSVRYGRKETWILKGIKSPGARIYWCDGNHEEHPVLCQDGLIHEMYENVFFCSRGSSLTLPDGRIVLFIGGADSIDKGLRTPGHDWFSEENIRWNEFEMAMGLDRVDIVISHTCPISFDIHGTMGKGHDSNRIALEQILEKYEPDLWFFGHWHKHQTGTHNNTKWCCLDYPGHSGKWWTWLE